MKNTNQLVGKDFEEMKIKVTSAEELEQMLVAEHIDQSPLNLDSDSEKAVVMQILNSLNE